ncbi:MAG: transporter substrate-binding domain-containing protein [Myxococcota bacterium]
MPLRTLALALLWTLALRAHAAPPLRVAMSGSYPPLHERTDDGFVGFEPDLAALIAAHLGRPLELVDAHGSTLDAVRTGAADIAMNAITATAERSRRVDFTRPYLELRYLLAGLDAGVDPATLDARVAVTSDLAAAALVAAAPNATVVRKPSLAAALEAFGADEVDWIAGEDVALVDATAQVALAVSQRGFGRSAVAIATAPGAAAPYDEALAALAPQIEALKERWRPGVPGARPNGLHGLSVGRDQVCAIRADDNVVCWDGRPPRVYHRSFASIDAVSSCGVNAFGSLICWAGKDVSLRATRYRDVRTIRGKVFAQSQHGNAFDAATALGYQTYRVRDVCEGRRFLCELSLAGIATCTGAAATGVPTRPLAALACGAEHACGRTEDGAAVCWGEDEALRRPPGGTFADIVAGDGLSCGLDPEHTAHCWPATHPVAAMLDGTVVRELVATPWAVCGIQGDGTPFCADPKRNGWLAGAPRAVPVVGEALLDGLEHRDWEVVGPGWVRERWCGAGTGLEVASDEVVTSSGDHTSAAPIVGVGRAGGALVVRTATYTLRVPSPAVEAGYRIWHLTTEGHPMTGPYVPKDSTEVPITDACPEND